jgi:hypothetical protein
LWIAPYLISPQEAEAGSFANRNERGGNAIETDKYCHVKQEFERDVVGSGDSEKERKKK